MDRLRGTEGFGGWKDRVMKCSEIDCSMNAQFCEYTKRHSIICIK